MGKSNIGWTDVSWNPVTGCSRVSPGCEHCYAETLSLRRGWSKKPWTAQNVKDNVVLHPDRLDHPLHWREPRMVFVNSMSDVFHGMIPYDFLDKMFAVMVVSPTHTFQVLTKRAAFMREYMSQDGIAGAVAAETGSGVDGLRRWPFIRPDDLAAMWPPNNVWLGVSVEDQRRADERLAILSDVPVAVRWVSCEPLLGPIDFRQAGSLGPEVGDPLSFSALSGTEDTDPSIPGIDWVVVGGETGTGHRRMKIEWLESVVEQCRTASVPVFVKQDSGPKPGKQGRIPDELWALKQFPEMR